jgi:hypothetical protein
MIGNAYNADTREISRQFRHAKTEKCRKLGFEHFATMKTPQIETNETLWNAMELILT